VLEGDPNVPVVGKQCRSRKRSQPNVTGAARKLAAPRKEPGTDTSISAAWASDRGSPSAHRGERQVVAALRERADPSVGIRMCLNIVLPLPAFAADADLATGERRDRRRTCVAPHRRTTGCASSRCIAPARAGAARRQCGDHSSRSSRAGGGARCRTNQSLARRATSSIAPRSPKRCVAPGTIATSRSQWTSASRADSFISITP
jgi:hypothetical protein